MEQVQETAVEMTPEQQHINMLSQNMKYLTNRLVNTEMALDVFLGILFDKESGEDLKEQFEKLFRERMDSIREQYEEQEKKQAEAMSEANANTAKPEENIDVIVNPTA